MGKGVSKEDKRKLLLAMFRNSKAVWTKKDWESQGPRTGVIASAVEGIVKELVGDDLVREEKVGISTYWWAFPGDATAKKSAELAQLQAEVAKLRSQADSQEQAQQAAQQAAGGEGEAKEAEALQSSLEALRARQKTAQDEAAKLAKAGGEDWAARKADLPNLLDGVNRWTDNTFTIQKELQDRRGMEKREANKVLGINDDFDYVEVSLKF